MTEIAFASGFGSIRRFNETFLTLFGRTPGELRGTARPDISAGSQGRIDLLLRYHPPYDWPAMLEFLRCRAIPGIEQVTGQTYKRSRSEEHTSELQSLMRISYAVFCLKKKIINSNETIAT